MYGELKRKQLLASFGMAENTVADDLEKGNKLNTSHLVLKEVSVNGKMVHRWVDPNKGHEEYAPHGSKVELEHKGSKVTGTVGGQSKTGEYAIKLDKEHGGGVINKHPHQFESPSAKKDGEAKPEGDKPAADPKQFALKTETPNLEKFVANKDSDPALVKIAQRELEKRKGDKSTQPAGEKGQKTPQSAEKSDSKTKEDGEDAEKFAPKDDADDDGPDKVSAEEEQKKTGASAEDVDNADHGAGDINRRFKTFERFTKAVIKGKMKSMIAYGSGGVGKTYTVTKQLEEAGKKEFTEGMEPGSDDYDYVKITGKATAASVYQALYEHNGKIVLFDDCDSVLSGGDSSKDSVNLLKGALDTSGDGTISYGSARALKDSNGNAMPQRITFTGRCIFVSNLPPDKVPQPIKSRSLRIDMTMDPQQTIDRLKQIATSKSGEYQNLKFPGPDGEPQEYSHDEMESAINFLDKYKHKTSDLNVRTIGSLLAIIKEAKEDGDEDWQTDAKHMIFSKSIHDDDLIKALEYLDVQ